MMFNVFPTNNLLLNYRIERLIHGRLAKVIPRTDKLKNQAQEPFHVGTLYLFHISRRQRLAQRSCRPDCCSHGFWALPL